jgi:hypothetical protein
MVVSYHYGQQRNQQCKQMQEITGNFDHHVNAAVQRGAHLPMEHNQGFN